MISDYDEKKYSDNALTGKITNSSVIADATEAFQGYYSTEEKSLIRGRIDYRIYFRTTEGSNPNLKKPVLIIDGFDPGDKRRIEDIDCENDPTCAQKYVNCGSYKPDRHTSIRDLMQTSDTKVDLIDDLRSKGYDVIIVNNPTYISSGRKIDGGADYIERNALALTRLIRNLNTELTTKGSTEKLVIIGPSMGGQISRYALAYMEQKHNLTKQSQWLHNTRLWISIDSPHLGANIPIGIQSLLHQLYNKDVEAVEDFVVNQLGSPAARQQLIEQVYPTQYLYGDQLNPTYLDGRTKSQGFSVSRGAPTFTRFYDNLFKNGLPNSKGYPQNLKVALINGSLSGSKKFDNPFKGGVVDQFAADGERVLELVAFQKLIIKPWKEHVSSLETNFANLKGKNAKISRFKKAFYDKSVYLTNNNSRGNMDNIPGGWYNSQEELNYSTACTYPANAQGSFWLTFRSAWNNIMEGLSSTLGGTNWETRVLKEANSFISSFSSIGYKSPDKSWAQALDQNLVCQNLTPFDTYFGQDKNTRHTSFTKASADWLLLEIAKSPQEPYFPVNPNNLTIDTFICGNTTKTYSFEACDVPGNVIKWETSSYLQKLNTSGKSITVKAPLDKNTAGSITAIFKNGVKVTKDFWIGKTIFTTRVFGSCYEPRYELKSDPLDKVMEWKIIQNGKTSYRAGSSIILETYEFNLADGKAVS